MKKYLLIISFFGICIAAFAQSQAIFSPIHKSDKSAAGSRVSLSVRNMLPNAVNSTTPVARKINSGNNNINGTPLESVIGYSDYDLQTYGSIYPRITKNPDGTISATWHNFPDGAVQFPRGTAYNYFDGANWLLPTDTNIEFPKGVSLSSFVVTASGQEATFAGSYPDSVLLYTHRPTKGSGSWLLDTISLKSGGYGNIDAYAHAVCGGVDTLSIHCIANTADHGYDGGNIVYSRSTDDGVTWNKVRDTIPGLGNGSYPNFINLDSYCIAARGDAVAIVIGDLTTNIALFKSVDNGSTWTKTFITNQWTGGSYNPDGNISDINADGIADTVETTAGDVNVVIDNNGICHVFWGMMRMADTNATAGNDDFEIFPATNGIKYWNEITATPTVITGAIDWNNNGQLDIATYPADPNEQGWGQYGSMGMAATPNAAIDAGNNIYLAFMALDESSDTILYGKTHYQVYVTISKNIGLTWSVPRNVITETSNNMDSLYFEGVYPSIAKSVDSNMYIEYQRDYIPGAYWGSPPGSVDAVENDPAGNVQNIVVAAMPVIPVNVGFNEMPSKTNSFFVSQNQPNPASGNSVINVIVSKTSDLKLEISNIEGSVIYTFSQNKIKPGNHAISINTSAFAKGFYFYSVTVNGEKITKKMIVD